MIKITAMSERSLSPVDFCDMKHVRTLKVKGQDTSIKRQRTLLYRNKEQMEKEYQKTNRSCDCSECGKCSEQSLNIKKLYPLNETNQRRRRRILRRFKAVGNAIIFVLTYKVEAIKKFKKRMHILRAVRNLTTVRKPQAISSAQPQQQITQPQAQRIKTTSDVEDTFVIHHGYPEPRKSHVSQYMSKMLKDVNPKKEALLKPLMSVNKKMKQINSKSVTQSSLSSLPQFCELNKSQANNHYSNNNRDILKIIDSMKVKHRIIRCKK